MLEWDKTADGAGFVSCCACARLITWRLDEAGETNDGLRRGMQIRRSVCSVKATTSVLHSSLSSLFVRPGCWAVSIRLLSDLSLHSVLLLLF